MNKMIRTKDLMTGDWVLINGTPHKIQAVDGVDNEIMADDELYTLVEDRYHSEDKVEGVPITLEILEKNKMREFEHRNPGQGDNLIKKWWHKDGSYYVSLYSVGDEYTYTVGDSITRICRIRYVHELQHALQLCGIEKEIII